MMKNYLQRGRLVLNGFVLLVLLCDESVVLPCTTVFAFHQEIFPTWHTKGKGQVLCHRSKSINHHYCRPCSVFLYEASGLASESSNEGDASARARNVRFISPLLEYGYCPAVDEYENKAMLNKPLLLYLPGFDGTFLSPFLQFPELHTIFDVRCMTVAMDDRSTLDELRDDVIQYLEQECLLTDTDRELAMGNAPFNTTLTRTVFKSERQDGTHRRSIYLAGESFGGILASVVTLALLQHSSLHINGLTLINAATCYDRSRLAIEGPKVAKLPKWIYPVGLMNILPLFMDEYSAEQLLLMLKSKALPSVIDNECREAYMGRVAFSLPFVIPYMAQETLRWRLTAWLETGCARLATGDRPMSKLNCVRTLIIAGEKDATLPSIAEAERLASIMPDSVVHVVEGAGHASTCGSRVDLAALFRYRFDELRPNSGKPTVPKSNNPLNIWQQQEPHRTPGQQLNSRTAMKAVAANCTGAYFGMEPRYDNATIGLNPLRYWSKKNYRKFKPRSR